MGSSSRPMETASLVLVAERRRSGGGGRLRMRLAAAILVTREGRVLFKSGAMASAHPPFTSSSSAASSTSTCTGCRCGASTASPRHANRIGHLSKAALGLAVGASLGALLPGGFPSSSSAAAPSRPHHLPSPSRLGSASPRSSSSVVSRLLALCDCTGARRRRPPSQEELRAAVRGQPPRRGLTYPPIAREESGVVRLRVRESGEPVRPAASVAGHGRAPRLDGGRSPPCRPSADLLAAQPRRQRLDGRRRARRHPLRPHRRSRRDHGRNRSWLAKAMENVIAADGSERLELHGDDRSATRRRSQNEAANLRLYGRTSTPRPYEPTARRTRSRRRRPTSPLRRARAGPRARLHLRRRWRLPARGSPADAADARLPGRRLAACSPRGSRGSMSAGSQRNLYDLRQRRPPPATPGAATAPARRWACRSE